MTQILKDYYDFKEVMIVGSPDELFYMQKHTDIKIFKGGESRQESVLNALQHVKTKFVMITDVARACAPKSLILNLIREIGDADIAVPYISVLDTVVFDENAIAREKVKLIQTPQLSKTEVLLKALSQHEEFTDESSAIKSFGGNVKYIKGSNKAKKLTTINDIKNFSSLLKKPSKNTFAGIGFDVHAYEQNKPMILGGVKIQDNFGFKAHSDGDVLTHALIDALLGAIGAGDIGEWFPDTNMKYFGADSIKLLEKVCAFVKKVGYEIVHVDIIIMAQTPRLNEFKLQISKTLAKVMNIESLHVNIKATTTENLGFIGRSEGMSAQAIVTLKFYDWTKNANTYCRK